MYTPKSDSDPIRYYIKSDGKSGFYFWDETWSDLIGPFETLEECQNELKEYAQRL